MKSAVKSVRQSKNTWTTSKEQNITETLLAGKQFISHEGDKKREREREKYHNARKPYTHIYIYSEHARPVGKD